MDPTSAIARRRAPTGPRPAQPAVIRDLKLGPTKQDALVAILEFFHRLDQGKDEIDLPSILSQIVRYFDKTLTASQSGKLEFDLSRNDWQVWTKYRKGLSDFHSHYAHPIRTEVIKEYEDLNEALRANEPWILVDENFTALATKIFALAPHPPPDVDLKYWYSITPHVFTITEAQRAISKVGMLHQEFQWATYGDWTTKQLWLFVWRTLKQMWMLHKLNDHAYPNAIAAAVSQLEEPFLNEHNRTFSRMNRTFEVLHHGHAEMLVSDFASRCHMTLSRAQQSDLVTAGNLDEDSKRCLHEFIHAQRDLTAKTIRVLREAAGQYHARMLHDLQDFEDVTSDANEAVAHKTPAEQKNVYALPLSLPRRSAYDYVWYDLPDTRAREVAESRRIHRDMTEPGIQSDGLRAYELINTPPRHAQRPDACRGNKFAPWSGAFSLCFRVAKLMLLGKNLARPRPKYPVRISKRRFSKDHSDLPPSPSGYGGTQKQDPKLPAVLSPLRDNARRVSKPTAHIQLPQVKLRGGGSRGSNPISEAARRSRSESRVSKNFNQPSDKEHSKTPSNKENSGPTSNRGQHTPVGSRPQSRASRSSDSANHMDKENDVSSPDSVPHSSQDAKYQITSSDQGEQFATPTGQVHADDHTRRHVHAGAHGYATDSHSGDNRRSPIPELPPEPLFSPTELRTQILLQRKAEHGRQLQTAAGSGADQETFNVLAGAGASHPEPGLIDHINQLEYGVRRLFNAAGSLFQPPDIENVRSLEQDNQLQQCHPCPAYPGQYHHACDGRCIANEPLAAEADDALTEPQSLHFDPEATMAELSTLLAHDVSAVTTRQAEGASLNEAQLHVRLCRIFSVATQLFGPVNFEPHSHALEWSAFLLPETIEPDTPLSYDTFSNAAAILGDADGHADALEALALYAGALIERHYGKNLGSRLQDPSVRVRSGEKLRTFIQYRNEAMKLQKTLRALAELFQEVDGLAGTDHQRRSHHDHHDHFRLANDHLLVIRRGLGQQVTNEEYDNVPAWQDYRGQGVAPHEQLYAMLMRAADALDPVVEFFKSGDSSLAIDTGMPEDVVTSLRDILYTGIDGQKNLEEDSIQGEVNEGAEEDEQLAIPKEIIDLTKDGPPGSVPAIPEGIGVKGPKKKRRQRKKSQRSSGSSQGSRRSSTRKSSEETSDSSRTKKKRKTLAEDHPAKESSAKGTPGENKSTGKATPTETLARAVPRHKDYEDFMYTDEARMEVMHRGFQLSELTKPKAIELLVAADAVGNRGLGVMRTWRMMTGKRARQGRRPTTYKLPSVAEVKEKFGDRLV